ncbi:hypothetical protein OIO90_003880 [Microbotryomycetes sp. JL221]|nr:hypothetical protein OIO90_003880 [Microbotryomycetes sp. JL221]
MRITDTDRQEGYALPSTFEERKAPALEPVNEAAGGYATRAVGDDGTPGNKTTRWHETTMRQDGPHHTDRHGSTSKRRSATPSGARSRPRRRKPKSLSWWQKPRLLIIVMLVVLAVALGIGLGVGLGLKKDDAATQAIGNNNNGGSAMQPSVPAFPSISRDDGDGSNIQPAVSTSDSDSGGIDGLVPVGPRTELLGHVVPRPTITPRPIGPRRVNVDTATMATVKVKRRKMIQLGTIN